MRGGVVILVTHDGYTEKRTTNRILFCHWIQLLVCCSWSVTADFTRANRSRNACDILNGAKRNNRTLHSNHFGHQKKLTDSRAASPLPGAAGGVGRGTQLGTRRHFLRSGEQNERQSSLPAGRRIISAAGAAVSCGLDSAPPFVHFLLQVQLCPFVWKVQMLRVFGKKSRDMRRLFLKCLKPLTTERKKLFKQKQSCFSEACSKVLDVLRGQKPN